MIYITRVILIVLLWTSNVFSKSLLKVSDDLTSVEDYKEASCLNIPISELPWFSKTRSNACSYPLGYERGYNIFHHFKENNVTYRYERFLRSIVDLRLLSYNGPEEHAHYGRIQPEQKYVGEIQSFVKEPLDVLVVINHPNYKVCGHGSLLPEYSNIENIAQKMEKQWNIQHGANCLIQTSLKINKRFTPFLYDTPKCGCFEIRVFFDFENCSNIVIFGHNSAIMQFRNGFTRRFCVDSGNKYMEDARKNRDKNFRRRNERRKQIGSRRRKYRNKRLEQKRRGSNIRERIFSFNNKRFSEDHPRIPHKHIKNEKLLLNSFGNLRKVDSNYDRFKAMLEARRNHERLKDNISEERIENRLMKDEDRREEESSSDSEESFENSETKSRHRKFGRPEVSDGHFFTHKDSNLFEKYEESEKFPEVLVDDEVNESDSEESLESKEIKISDGMFNRPEDLLNGHFFNHRVSMDLNENFNPGQVYENFNNIPIGLVGDEVIGSDIDENLEIDEIRINNSKFKGLDDLAEEYFLRGKVSLENSENSASNEISGQFENNLDEVLVDNKLISSGSDESIESNEIKVIDEEINRPVDVLNENFYNYNGKVKLTENSDSQELYREFDYTINSNSEESLESSEIKNSVEQVNSLEDVFDQIDSFSHGVSVISELEKNLDEVPLDERNSSETEESLKVGDIKSTDEELNRSDDSFDKINSSGSSVGVEIPEISDSNEIFGKFNISLNEVQEYSKELDDKDVYSIYLDTIGNDTVSTDDIDIIKKYNGIDSYFEIAEVMTYNTDDPNFRENETMTFDDKYNEMELK